MTHMRFSVLRVALSALLALMAFSPAAAQQPPNATNRLHMYSKPAVVRIISGYVGKWQWRGRQWPVQLVSSGSGFIINPDGYILTNAHVVSDVKDGDDEGRRKLTQQFVIQVLKSVGEQVNQQTFAQAAQILQSTGASLVSFQRINYVFLQSGNRFPYEIKSYGAPTGEGKDLSTGKDVAVIKIEVKNAPTLRLGNSDQVQVGDQVWVLGYPGAADSEALDEKSQLEPTTNDGKISAKKTSADGAPILQTNTSTTHGNSGGPAINEKGEVIGLLTFRGNTVNGQEVQGFNFIVPVNTAQEFVRQAGTDNKPSAIDAKWREGLNQFWKQEYSHAKESFSEVIALYKDHSEAQKLITESQEHIAKGEDRSGSVLGGLIVLMVLGLGFLLLVGGTVLAVVMIKKRQKAAAYARPQPPNFTPPPGYTPQPGPRQPEVRPQPVSNPSGAGAAPAYQPTTRLADAQKTELFLAAAEVKLICTAGPLQGQEFVIGHGVFIGRDGARSQIVVPDPQVSGQHLWIGPDNGRIVARDNGSTNGTFLNNQLGQRITEVELQDRDVLTLGARGMIKFALHC